MPSFITVGYLLQVLGRQGVFLPPLSVSRPEKAYLEQV